MPAAISVRSVRPESRARKPHMASRDAPVVFRGILCRLLDDRVPLVDPAGPRIFAGRCPERSRQPNGATMGPTFIIVVVIVLYLFGSIRVLRQYERGVVFLLGKFAGGRGPGLH